MNIRSLLSGIEFELPVRLWTGEATHGFEKLLRYIFDCEEAKHQKLDNGSPFEYLMTIYGTLKVFNHRRRVKRLHDKVLATHRKNISKSK
jgi:hypothetical protein